MKKKSKTNKIKKESIGIGVSSGIIASLCCIGPLIIILFGLGSVSFALSISQYRPYFLGLGFLFMVSAIVLHLRKKNKTCDINCFTIEGLKGEKNFIISVLLSMGLIYILALYVVMPAISPIIYGGATSKITLLSPATESFEQICKDNNHKWMKMKPMRDGRFMPDQECFGCMPDEKNHICDKNEYLSFIDEQTKTTPTDAVNEKIETINDLHKLTLKIDGMTCAGCAYGLQSILESLNGVVEAKVYYPEGNGIIIYDPLRITKEEIVKASDVFSMTIIDDELYNEK